MSERLILEGALHEKKMAHMKLATHAEGLIRALRVALIPASAVPLKDIRTAEIRLQAAELDDVHTEYLQLSRDIAEIEKELGR